jgi:hypothetical protein
MCSLPLGGSGLRWFVLVTLGHTLSYGNSRSQANGLDKWLSRRTGSDRQEVISAPSVDAAHNTALKMR